ncbi:hypothetical protein F4W70_04180 [Pseudomonas cannabina]|nr:hypothetical protein F4W70_04180 [Pseudomonas cannabina]
MANADNLDIREGLKKPFLQKSKPVNTGAPARFLSKKMGFFRGYLVGFGLGSASGHEILGAIAGFGIGCFSAGFWFLRGGALILHAPLAGLLQ